MGPRGDRARPALNAPGHADQPFRGNHRLVLGHPVVRPAAQEQRESIRYLSLMQDLGRDERRRQALAEAEQSAKPGILGFEHRQCLRLRHQGVALGLEGLEAGPARLPFLGSLLQLHQRQQNGPTHKRGDRVRLRRWRKQKGSGDDEADQEQRGVTIGVRAIRRG